MNNSKKRRINNRCACSLPWCDESRAQSVFKECTVPFPVPGAPEFDYYTASLNVDSHVLNTNSRVWIGHMPACDIELNDGKYSLKNNSVTCKYYGRNDIRNTLLPIPSSSKDESKQSYLPSRRHRQIFFYGEASLRSPPFSSPSSASSLSPPIGRTEEVNDEQGIPTIPVSPDISYTQGLRLIDQGILESARKKKRIKRAAAAAMAAHVEWEKLDTAQHAMAQKINGMMRKFRRPIAKNAIVNLDILDNFAMTMNAHGRVCQGQVHRLCRDIRTVGLAASVY